MPSGERFRASEATRSRWGRRQKAVRLAAIPFGLIVVIRLATSPGLSMSIVLLVTLAVIVIATTAYCLYRRDPHRFPEGSLWAGTGTLITDAVRDAHLDQNMTFKSNFRLKYWTQGRRVLSARLRVLPEGLRWDFALTARLAGVRGFVAVAWEDIAGVEIGDVPGVLNKGLGGGYTVRLSRGVNLDGAFVGSRVLLLEALERSPVAPSS